MAPMTSSRTMVARISAEEIGERLADGGRGAEYAELERFVVCGVEVRQVEEPDERGTDDGAEHLREEEGGDVAVVAGTDGDGGGDGGVEVGAGAAAGGGGVSTPQSTAKAQPAVMTIQPAFSALDCLRRTPATTPSPSRMTTRVPRNSPKKGDSMGTLSRVRKCAYAARRDYCVSYFEGSSSIQSKARPTAFFHWR